MLPFGQQENEAGTNLRFVPKNGGSHSSLNRVLPFGQRKKR